MTVLEFFSLEQNFSFSVALTLMFFIALMEGVLTLLGLGLSQLLDSLLPELDIESPDINSVGSLSKLLGWLRLGKLPALIWLIIFLTLFGLFGLTLQFSLQNLTGQLLPNSIASLPVLFSSLLTLHYLGNWLALFMPSDETDAVSEQSFIGSLATITLGTAKKDYPAEAKVTDHLGKTHYLMIEPDETTQKQFNQGDQVLIISQQNTTYLAVKNQDTAFLEQ